MVRAASRREEINLNEDKMKIHLRSFMVFGCVDTFWTCLNLSGHLDPAIERKTYTNTTGLSQSSSPDA